MPEERRRFADLETVGGYPCGEAASALQKAIRRGEERAALFWASELDLSGYGAYVWKRLRIIASEDVGLADPLMPVKIRALYENWQEETKRQKSSGSGDRYAGFVRVFLVHAVIELARAEKSRMLDHALVVAYAAGRPRREVPDEALDQHTRRGRQLGRGARHFVDEGSQLRNTAAIADPYADQARQLLLGGAAPRTDAAAAGGGAHHDGQQLELEPPDGGTAR